MLLDVDLVPHLVESSVQLHRLRHSLGPGADIMPAIDPPWELAELTDRYGGEADRALRAHRLGRAFLRQGEVELARRHADETLSAATEEQRPDGFLLLGAVALAQGDGDGARAHFSQAIDAYDSAGNLDARAATEHNLGVVSSLAGDAEGAAVRFAAAATRLPPVLDWSVTQVLNPGSSSVTRPIGAAGLPLLMKAGAEWSHLPTAAGAPRQLLTLTTGDGALVIDLAAGAAELESTVLKPRVTETVAERLIIDLADRDLFTATLAHVRGFALPMALGDTYHALGRYDLADRYFRAAASYRYLNQAIELPVVWARLARTYVAEGDRHYRQQDTTAATAAYERVVRVVDGGFELVGPLYEGAFEPLAEETLELLKAPDPLTFDAVDYARRIVVLQALSSLQQIANSINYLGIPDDVIPIHPWRYLQNQARYFAGQAIQAERAYLTFKGTAEKEAFTRLALEQAVAAQKSAVKVEQKKLEVAEEQERVARASRKLAEDRIQRANESWEDYAAVAEQTAFYDEMSAFYAAPEGGVHVDPDHAQKLGIQLTHVHERYTGLFGSSDFYYVKDVAKSDLFRTMNRSRSKLTRELELRNLDRKISDLGGELEVAKGQVSSAVKGKQAAQAQLKLAELHARQAGAQLAAFQDQELTPELWDRLAEAQREISQRYLNWAIGAAFLMERAYEFEYDTTANRICTRPY